MRHLLLTTATVGAIVVACLQLSFAPATAAPTRPETLPAGCSVPEVLDMYQRFFNATESPDPEPALTYVAPREEQVKGAANPVFQIGKSTGEEGPSRKLVASNSPRSLYRFFVGRARTGSSFSVLSLAIASEVGGETGVGVVFQVRIKVGPRSILQAGGKGAIECESGRFSLWQMGIHSPERRGSACGGIRVDAEDPPRKPVTCRLPF